MEGLDAAGDLDISSDWSEQDPSNLYADPSHGLFVSVPVWLRTLLLLL